MSTPCLSNIIDINREECIGDAREDINNNFTNLGNAACALDTSQIGIEAQLIYLLPYGGIINLWGDITLGGLDFDLSGRGKVNSMTGRDITGFALCNGGNGTPDLRDRFVVAAGSNYTQGQRGPIFDSTSSLEFSSIQLTIPEMPRHNHDIFDPTHNHVVVDLPHQHVYNDLYNPGIRHTLNSNLFGAIAFGFTQEPNAAHALNGGNPAPPTWQNTDAPNNTSLRRFTDASSSFVTVEKASSNVDILETGNDLRHENRPPYFALAYIMRVEL